MDIRIKKMALSRMRMGQKTAARVLLHVYENAQNSDSEIAEALDLSVSSVAQHLRKLRELGIIKTQTHRYFFPNGCWSVQRTIQITELGENAISESKVSLEAGT